MKRKSGPDQVDRQIGARIRSRRMEIGLSQTDLAEAAGGVTFQQVQKYEKGVNRVSGSRMAQIAAALKVQVSYFFEDIAGAAQGQAHTSPDIQSFVADRKGLAIIKAWAKLRPKLRESFARAILAAATSR